ncbi:MAG TPA: ATP-binding protein [Kineosporiaceae bacterium]
MPEATGGGAVRRLRGCRRRFVGVVTHAVAPVSQVVAGAALAGAAATGAVLWRAGDAGPVLTLGWLGGPALLVVLTALTCAGELIAVRLHHRDVVEELTLLDPMVLLDVLLLPPRQAIAACLAGLVPAYLIRRRAPVKALFNLGTYAAAGSVLILLLRACSGGAATFDVRLIAALAAGTTGFVAVNLLFLSALFAALGAGSVLVLVRQDLRLSLFTLVSTMALTATVVTVAVHTPAFLPFTVLPAAAITYAYQATATEVEERRRSAQVLAFSQVLAGSPSRHAAVESFLRLAAEGFIADEGLALIDDEAFALDGASGLRSLAPHPSHGRLLTAAAESTSVLQHDLPSGWSQAMVAPLEADGSLVGAVALGWHDRRAARSRDRTLLTPLASALAVALSNADHLARLVAQTSKLRAVLDQSGDGILVLDGTGVVQLWNPALERLTSHRAETAVGRPLGTLLDAEDADGHPADAFEAARSRLTPADPEVAVDLEIIRPDGERRSVRCAHAATFDPSGELVRDVVNVHDLTRERQLERLKSDFVATVSHELRTPVTPIKGYAELLIKHGDSMPAPKRARALEMIADRAAHLTRLVEDLLLASSISGDTEPARSVVLGTAELTALARRAGEDFSALASRLVVTAPDTPVSVRCDRTRTIQILTNLLSNALKYAPGDSRVQIMVDTAAGQGRVTVRDEGPGMPADQLERIFEKFHRIEDPMVMSTGGSGLGLYIARHLARAMAGDLTVSSRLGQGSAFTLHLPLVMPSPVAVP